MRLGINALAVSPERPGGDATYVLEMVRRLPLLDSATEWVVFVSAAARHLLGDLPENVRCVICPVPRGSLVVRALWEQSALVPLAVRERLDVLFAPINVLPVAYPGRLVLTLHEAEPFMPQTRIPGPLLVWWRVMRTLSARRANRILTVSEAARQDLVRWMRISPEQVHVVHLGVDLARFSRAARSDPPPLGGAPYVLWVGRPYPRKNLGALLNAFADLRRSGRPERLVLLGPAGWDEAALKLRVLAGFDVGSVFRLPAMWMDLPGWYAGAAAFAFPSTQETFGLPILEAMASGTPVVAADIPALREVGGEAVLYAHPHRPDELADRLRQILTEPELSTRIRALGLVQAARFDWQATARQTHAHVQSVAAMQDIQ